MLYPLCFLTSLNPCEFDCWNGRPVSAEAAGSDSAPVVDVDARSPGAVRFCRLSNFLPRILSSSLPRLEYPPPRAFANLASVVEAGGVIEGEEPRESEGRPLRLVYPEVRCGGLCSAPLSPLLLVGVSVPAPATTPRPTVPVAEAEAASGRTGFFPLSEPRVEGDAGAPPPRGVKLLFLDFWDLGDWADADVGGAEDVGGVLLLLLALFSPLLALVSALAGFLGCMAGVLSWDWDGSLSFPFVRVDSATVGTAAVEVGSLIGSARRLQRLRMAWCGQAK